MFCCVRRRGARWKCWITQRSLLPNMIMIRMIRKGILTRWRWKPSNKASLQAVPVGMSAGVVGGSAARCSARCCMWVSSGHWWCGGDTLSLLPGSRSQKGLARSFIIVATCAVTTAGASLRASLSPLVKAISLRPLVRAFCGQGKKNLGVPNINFWQAWVAKRRDGPKS